MNTKRKVIAGAVAALAITGGGAAIAASRQSADERSKAIVADAAGKLGVTPAKLTDALKQAYEDQIDADVAAGRITKAQGDELEQRIEASDFPLLGGPGFGGPRFHDGFGEGLAAATAYLGISADELRTQLESGKTLAQIANAMSGKSANGLIDALVAAEQKEHPDAPNADVKQHVSDLVNGKLPPPRERR